MSINSSYLSQSSNSDINIQNNKTNTVKNTNHSSLLFSSLNSSPLTGDFPDFSSRSFFSSSSIPSSSSSSTSFHPSYSSSSSSVHISQGEVELTHILGFTDVYNRVVNLCYDKCWIRRNREDSLEVGEKSCCDRCIHKYIQIHKLVGEELKKIR